jgi:tRNA threonylcarbamoyladenosine modification (KEOPS) complex  Pcc1 subunit
MIKSKDLAKVVQEPVNVEVRSSKYKPAASKGVAKQEWDANCLVAEAN